MEKKQQSGAAGAINSRSLALGISCYLIWGFFPLYFRALAPAGAVEVIVHRAFWGLLCCLVALAALGRLGQLKAAFQDRVVLTRLSLAGALIVLNWSVYVYAVLSGHTIDAALGYFINPLVTVALGLVVMRETISAAQKVALALGALAVVVLVIGLGKIPWVSLVLAVSFGLYALVKKKVALRVGPLEGLAVETAAVVPFLLCYYVYLAVKGETSIHVLERAGQPWVGHLLLLAGAGLLTMIPLVMFAASARGLPLGVMGLIQYICPIIQMLVGLLVFGEVMETGRWIGTGIVWVALVVLSVDWMVGARHSRRLPGT